MFGAVVCRAAVHGAVCAVCCVGQWGMGLWGGVLWCVGLWFVGL